MRQMIRDVPLSFNLFNKATIIKATNPFRNVVIRLLLYNEKYYWITMMDFDYKAANAYYVDKDLTEATAAYIDEVAMW